MTSVNLIMRLDTFPNHGGILKGQRSVEQRSETKGSHVNQARCPRGEAHVWSRQFKRLENQRRVNYTPCKFWWMHRRGAGRLQRKTNGEISQTQYYLHFKVCWGTRGDREDAAALIHFTLTEICIRVQEQIKTAWTDKNSPNVLVICIADVLRFVKSWPRRGLWLLKPLSFFLKCLIISAFLHFWHLGSTWRLLLCIRGKIKETPALLVSPPRSFAHVGTIGWLLKNAVCPKACSEINQKKKGAGGLAKLWRKRVSGPLQLFCRSDSNSTTIAAFAHSRALLAGEVRRRCCQ